MQQDTNKYKKETGICLPLGYHMLQYMTGISSTESRIWFEFLIGWYQTKRESQTIQISPVEVA